MKNMNNSDSKFWYDWILKKEQWGVSDEDGATTLVGKHMKPVVKRGVSPPNVGPIGPFNRTRGRIFKVCGEAHVWQIIVTNYHKWALVGESSL